MRVQIRAVGRGGDETAASAAAVTARSTAAGGRRPLHPGFDESLILTDQTAPAGSAHHMNGDNLPLRFGGYILSDRSAAVTTGGIRIVVNDAIGHAVDASR